MPFVDDIFDLAEIGISAFGELCGADPSAPTPSPSAPPAASPRPPRATATATATTAKTTPVAGTGRALAVQKFRVHEALDAQTGATVYVVTDGQDRAECSSRAFAERVRGLLG